MEGDLLKSVKLQMSTTTFTDVILTTLERLS